MEEAKITQFVRSFSKAISFFPSGTSFESGMVVLPKSADIVKSRSDLARLFDDLEKLSDKFNLKDEIDLFFSREGLVMRLSEHTLFESGVASISPKALPLLEKVGMIVAYTNYFIQIEGHTDDVPIHTTNFPSNWELSTARAVNVLRYFIEHHRIDSQRLAAEGFGEYRPLVPNDTLENRSKNRRVEVIFIRTNFQEQMIKEIP